MSKSSTYFSLLLALIGIKALLLLFFMGSGIIPLSPDEAQYWTWSQDLSFGYYSKPPAIAWQIALTTFLFGQSELAIRMGALVLGALFPLAVYLLAKKATANLRIAFYAALIALLSPFSFYLSYVATTDPGALLFATFALAFLVKGIRENRIHFGLSGLFFALALLYKWNVLWFLFVLVALIPFYRPLRKGGMGLIFLFVVLSFLPSLYWNWQLDFPTFRHVATTVAERASRANALDFIAAQFALLSPGYLLFFFFALIPLWKVRKEKKVLFFSTLFSLPFFLFIVMALFKKMQPNWAILFFSPMMVLAADFAARHKKRRFVIASCLALLFSLFALCAPLFPLPYKLNPYRQCMGNNQLTAVLRDVGYNLDTDFLFSDKYQAVSLLSYYGQERKRAYYFNISQSRKCQYSYDVPMSEKERGKRGLFVLIENMSEDQVSKYEERYLKSLSPYFEKVLFLGAKPLYFAKGKAVKYALIFRGENYNGKMPEEREVY